MSDRCADYPDVLGKDAEAFEIRLREIMDEDEACDAVQFALALGWRPLAAQVAHTATLREALDVARRDFNLISTSMTMAGVNTVGRKIDYAVQRIDAALAVPAPTSGQKDGEGT